MNTTSRTITGTIMIILGLGLIAWSFFSLETLFLLIYGVPLLILGLFILFNKNEDKIEKMKGGNK